MSVFDSPCPHGMPKPSCCVDCMDEGPVMPPTDDRLTAEYYTTAKFDGRCSNCEEPVFIGDTIGSTLKGWCCAGCCRA